MQFYWLNKENNENLIVFFAGWSFDEKPFEFLECGEFDVLFVYDYSAARQQGSYAAKSEEAPSPDGEGWDGVISTNNNKVLQAQQTENNPSTIQPFNFSTDKDLSPYNRKYLLTWSMGSFVAYKMRDLFKSFDRKIAINGTPFPVDDEYGIPQKPFLLTLKHAKIGLEGKFYQNIFEKEEEYQRYLKTPVERSIENRIEELQNLYEYIKSTPKTYEPFFDKAFVSMNDKIIPAKNQLKFWEDFGVHAETLESGHFPYYNFKSWKELI